MRRGGMANSSTHWMVQLLVNVVLSQSMPAVTEQPQGEGHWHMWTLRSTHLI